MLLQGGKVAHCIYGEEMFIKLFVDISASQLTFSAPQDVTNVIKTRSRLRVWGRKSSYLAGFFISFMVL